MKKTLTKITTLVATLSFFAVANASAWGPERQTFTMENPATYPTFNSITNNPTIGDERDFVRVGEINAKVTELKNQVEVVPGKQYLVYIYFHNNASSTYNDTEHDRSGIALRTRMSTLFPTVLTPGTKGKVSATITADNSNPLSVWDEAYFTTKTNKVILSYVDGSAKIYNDWKANGSVMPSNLFTSEGTLVGLNALNGVIPGCEEYHGVVTYVVEARELSGSVNKTVSTDGINYSENVTINQGDEVYFKIELKNTGDVGLTNTVIKDSLPEGLTLVSGSVSLTANSSTKPTSLSDNLVLTGYNLGRVGTGNTIYIAYKAKTPAATLPDCKSGKYEYTNTKLSNTATLTYDSDQASGDSHTDKATVTVKKATECKPDPDPEDPDPDPEDPEDPDPDPEDPEDPDPDPEDPEDPDPDPEPTPEPEPEPDPTPDPTPDPDEPEPEPVIIPDPDEKPTEIVNTGPLEVTLAVVIVLAIAGAGFYFWRTKHTLRTVEGKVSGKPEKNQKEASDNLKTENNREEKNLNQKPGDDNSSQN